MASPSLHTSASDLADTAPPVLIDFSPANTAAGAPVGADIVFTFDEAIALGQGVITLLDQRHNVIAQFKADDPQVTVSDQVLTINPPSDLPFGSTIWVRIDYGMLSDAAGNAGYYYQQQFRTALSSVALDVTGTERDDYLAGSDLDDKLAGAGGADFIAGNGGNDTIAGGDEDGYGDELDGGSGNDTIAGGAGRDWIRGGQGDDTLNGGPGEDHLLDSDGTNSLMGDEGNDILFSDNGGASLLDGGAGDDDLRGDLYDSYSGGAGADTIRITSGYGDTAPAGPVMAEGGDGDDRFELSSETIAARLLASGGAGADTFSFSNRSPMALTVTDFAVGPGGDRLDIIDLIGAEEASGNPFAAGQQLFTLEQDGADTVLRFDADGTGTAASPVEKIRLENVLAGTLSHANFIGGIHPDGSETGLSITGTDAGDTLLGDLLADTIDGGNGHDYIAGHGGDDVLDGGADDSHDYLLGGRGNDRLTGGGGNDDLKGGPGNDVLDGGEGNDYLVDDAGTNSLHGGAGDDRFALHGNGGGTVSCGAGNDTVEISYFYPGRPELTASGGEGADTYSISGYGGNGMLRVTDFQAGAGGDVANLLSLLPYNLEHNPFGDSGQLRLVQDGADTIVEFDADGAAHSASRFQPLMVLEGVAAKDLSAYNFAGLSPSGSQKGMTLDGTQAQETLRGGPLNDTLSGKGGSDTIHGAGGHDIIYGGDEARAGDTLSGGDGKDRLYGEGGDDRLAGNDGDDMLYGGDGEDYLEGGYGDDRLSGANGDDILSDSAGINTLDGGAGDDKLSAAPGSVLGGGAGNDDIRVTSAYSSSIAPGALTLVDGGQGNDLISFDANSAQASVRAAGGNGMDTFDLNYGRHEEKLAITDFRAGAGGDLLDLRDLLPWNSTVNPFGASGYLRLVQTGSDCAIEYDRDGAAGLEHGWATLLTLEQLDAGSLSAENFVGEYRPDGSGPSALIVGVPMATWELP